MATFLVRGEPDTPTHPVPADTPADVAAHRSDVEQALERILDSPAFHSSKRSRTFLRYAVEQTLAGQIDHLKERTIGAALFGRVPDYDTGTDAIVRVTASEVRRRLLQYYSETDGHSALIHLNAGTYLPKITILNPDESPSIPSPAPAQLDEAKSSQPTSRLILWSGWLLALALAVALAFVLWSRPRAPAFASLPWNGLFESDRTPQLVMADSAMGSLRTLYSFPPTLEHYADRSVFTPHPSLTPPLHFAWTNIAQKQFTSVADARIAAAVSNLAGRAERHVSIKYARDLQLGDFRRGENLILLGSHLSNPWVRLFDDQLHFQIDSDPNVNQEIIRIRDPKPGDPNTLATNATSGSTGKAYTALAYLQGLGGTGHVLIVQGTNMEGTELAGALALNPGMLERELRKCGLDPGASNAHFEILLRLNSTASSTRSSEVIGRFCRAD